LPDFFVAEVRLEAAAARFVVDLAGDLRAEAFTAVRLVLRAAVARAVDLRAVVLAAPRAVVERVVDFFAAVLRVPVERAVDFFAADLVDFAAVFLAAPRAVVERAVDFAAPRAVVLRAVDFAADLAEVLAEVFLAAVLRAVVFFAADFFAVDFTAERVEVLAAVFLAAGLRPAVFVPVVFVLLRAVDELAFFAPVFLEPLLAPVFFLVLVAPVSPVNNAVSGLDLISIGIAASFKGLRAQPSRLEGNVVIPSGFLLTDSVESRTDTFSVDTFTERPA
jgi:hypothetical protein